jgi:hypothetical protein
LAVTDAPLSIEPIAAPADNVAASRSADGRTPELWWIERVLRRYYGLFCTVVAALVIGDQVAESRGELRDWNWMLVSGFAVWLVALHFGLRLPGKVDQTVMRLADRGVFVTGERSVTEFLDLLHRRARRASIVGVVVCVTILAVAWLWFGWTAVKLVGFTPGELGPLLEPLIRTYLPLVAIELAAAVPAGLFVGRAASYAWLGRRMAADRVELRLDPEHLDEVAGLGPIGSLYAFQAMIIAIPAMFIGAWWFLIPLFPQYGAWRSAYAVMFAVTIVGELLVFLLPMRSFHVLMRAERERMQREGDALSAQYIAGWQHVRETAAAAGDPPRSPDQLAAIAARYKAIEGMPTWPVDARIRRRLELGNLLLFVPIIAEIAGFTNEWQALLDKIS